MGAMIARSLFLWLAFLPVLTAAEPAPLPDWTPWDVKALSQAPEFKWIEKDKPLKSLSYRGLNYQGKPTSVFAYYASPTDFGKSTAKKPATTTKYPAVVLVHGGGGRAFEQWVQLWAKRGYVAIAMDLAGKGAGGKRLPDGGPDQGHPQKFSTIDEPKENQWSYHAVANVLLAHSLLRSFEGVDVDRIGVTGISWGGYLTCIVAGVDSRFRFAMPVYGCGYLRDNSVWKESEFGKMTKAQSDKWNKLWDPASYLASAKMPVMFLNGTNDFAYPMDSYAKSCALVKTEKNYSIQLNMKHGHIFDFKEFFVFADQYLNQGTPMHVVGSPAVTNKRLSVEVESKTKLISARLHYTTEAHSNNRGRKWTSVNLQVQGKRVQGQAPPENATVWYVEVVDERGMVASSELTVK